jgi:2-phosphosulfolactate phosphatase
MKTINVFLSPLEVDESASEGSVAVVIDVIRATTTMVEALANGARAIIPTASTEEAVKLASSLGRKDTLLCGERKGLKVQGFDLGNSPAEFTGNVVGGKQLVMSTTNGTRAFLAAEDSDRVLAASFLNLSAVVATVREEASLLIVCAGKEDRFSLEDALCAGLLIRRLADLEGADFVLNDAARMVADLASLHEVDAEFLASTAAGNALLEVGLERDLEVCASLDRYSLVPEMRDRRIGLAIPKERS